MSIRFASPANAKKPHTIVIGETDGTFELLQGQVVHLREQEAHKLCAHCGKLAAIWLASKDKWQEHPQKCKR